MRLFEATQEMQCLLKQVSLALPMYYKSSVMTALSNCSTQINARVILSDRRGSLSRTLKTNAKGLRQISYRQEPFKNVEIKNMFVEKKASGYAAKHNFAGTQGVWCTPGARESIEIDREL